MFISLSLPGEVPHLLSLETYQVFVEKGQQFPADLVLISSSAEDGLAFIETAELDGETNLKKRQSLPSLLALNDDKVPPCCLFFFW